MSMVAHCRTNELCTLHDCMCECEGCLPHSNPEAFENVQLRARLNELEAEVSLLKRVLAQAHKSIARLNRRAQEAERIARRALRVGYATVWPLRSERDHYKWLLEEKFRAVKAGRLAQNDREVW